MSQGGSKTVVCDALNNELGMFMSIPQSGVIMTTAECREPGSCPLLKKGKITQNLNPKNKKYFKSVNMVKQKDDIGVFRHAESKSSFYVCCAISAP